MLAQEVGTERVVIEQRIKICLWSFFCNILLKNSSFSYRVFDTFEYPTFYERNFLFY